MHCRQESPSDAKSRMKSIGRQGKILNTRLSFLLLLGCAKYSSGYFWQPLKCYTATWQGKGQVCSGNYSGRTCARSQAEIEEYAGKLENTLNTGRVGLSQFLLLSFSLPASSSLFTPLSISRLPSHFVIRFLYLSPAIPRCPLLKSYQMDVGRWYGAMLRRFP